MAAATVIGSADPEPDEALRRENDDLRAQVELLQRQMAGGAAPATAVVAAELLLGRGADAEEMPALVRVVPASAEAEAAPIGRAEAEPIDPNVTVVAVPVDAQAVDENPQAAASSSGAPAAAASPGEHAAAAEAAPEAAPEAASGSERQVVILPGISGRQGQPGPPPTREELMERGVPAAQADALVVRSNEEQVLMEHYRCCILSFTCLVILMLPVILGVFVWMLVEFWRNREKECDVPLQLWCYVVWAVVLFNLCVRRLVIKFVCRWEPQTEDGQPQLNVPLRVKVLNISISIFMFVWTCLGLHWVRVSGEFESSHPACTEEAKGLYESVRTYAATNLCFTVFLYAYLHGISRILARMLHAGMLTTNQAAPSGALEQNTTVIEMGHELLKDQPSCSVCLEDFCDKKEMIATKECSHIFHKACLKNWLKVQRSCPLCRKDLGHMGPGPPPPLDGAADSIPQTLPATDLEAGGGAPPAVAAT